MPSVSVNRVGGSWSGRSTDAIHLKNARPGKKPFRGYTTQLNAASWTNVSNRRSWTILSTTGLTSLSSIYSWTDRRRRIRFNALHRIKIYIRKYYISRRRTIFSASWALLIYHLTKNYMHFVKFWVPFTTWNAFAKIDWETPVGSSVKVDEYRWRTIRRK